MYHDQSGPTATDGAVSEPSLATIRERQSALLWGMSTFERERAMWAGELSLHQLCEWSRRCPEQVPKIGGEFAWIVMTTPEWLDAVEARSALAEAVAL